MWSRVIEVMLGLWLILSVFIFRHPAEEWSWWATDLGCGLLTILLALFSFAPRCQRAHLGILGVAAWLIGFGYLGAEWPTPPALQNDMFLGLLLLMFAIVPTKASVPPEGWLPEEVRGAEHAA